jgi:Fe-S-cluster-containing hydrogenase component 2
MLEQNGIATKEMFEKLLPTVERRKQGPYVVMECYEEIPCDPCVTGCSRKAVSMVDINALPVVNQDMCNGCTRCVGICPGLACFVIDETVGDGKVKIVLPHEMLPVPEANIVVDALGRDGSVVGEAQVLKVMSGKSLDRTNLISILVDEELLYDVRSIRVR